MFCWLSLECHLLICSVQYRGTTFTLHYNVISFHVANYFVSSFQYPFSSRLHSKVNGKERQKKRKSIYFGYTTQTQVLFVVGQYLFSTYHVERNGFARRYYYLLLSLFHSQKPKIPRHESQEILASVKTGNYWRNNTKPDIIPSTSETDTLPRLRRRSRRSRPATAYGFPEISITNQSDQKTMRRKYHTLKSLVYKEPMESIKEMRQRPRSAGSTVRNKEVLSRPSLLETLDFINSVKNALCGKCNWRQT